MKKILYVSFIAMLFTSISFSVWAAKGETLKEKVAAMSVEEKKERFEEIKTRINEIKAMDRSTLTSDEKSDLKTELKSLKKEGKEVTRGVYLSFGAIVIIILLLILLL